MFCVSAVHLVMLWIFCISFALNFILVWFECHHCVWDSLQQHIGQHEEKITAWVKMITLLISGYLISLKHLWCLKTLLFGNGHMICGLLCWPIHSTLITWPQLLRCLESPPETLKGWFCHSSWESLSSILGETSFRLGTFLWCCYSLCSHIYLLFITEELHSSSL